MGLVGHFDGSAQLWDITGYQPETLTRTVDAYVVRLRYKLEADPQNPRLIRTIYGTGYSFMP